MSFFTSNREELKLEFQNFLKVVPNPYFVTFVFNELGSKEDPSRVKNYSLSSGKKMINLFYHRAQKELWGSNYKRKDIQKRMWGIGAPHHLESNMHYHFMMHISEVDRFSSVSNDIWRNYVPSGSIDIQSPSNQVERAKAGFYLAGEIWKEPVFKNFMILRTGKCGGEGAKTEGAYRFSS